MNRRGSNPFLNCLSVLVLLLFGIAPIHAQLVADFTADKTGGCSPFTTTFNNTTRGAGSNATYYWNFGNGNGSINRNASATFIEEKTYTVSLTVTDAGRTATKTMQIVVSRKPVADFKVAAPSGCLPAYAPQFTSTSTSADGYLSEFVWEWGDGTTSRESAATTSHRYSNPITPTVVLTVINNYGCAATTMKDQVTEVLPPLNTAFSADKTIICTVADAVSFTNTTTGPGNISYLWEFGDGKTATTKNASHVFDKAGEYKVALTATNDKGCTVKLSAPGTTYVAVHKLDLTTTPTLFCTANGSISFYANAYPSASSIQWKFSDNANTPYSGSYVYKSMPAAGNYSYTVKATIGACPVELTKTFTVFQSPVLPAFTVAVPKCGTPATLTYKDVSTWAEKWAWTLYDNNAGYSSYTTSTEKEPSKSYTRDGSFYTLLTATDANGCTASTSQTQSVTAPVVNINVVSSTAGSGLINCGQFDATFSASISRGTITDYSWKLSEGVTSTDAQPSNTFKTPGSHTISLNYTTSDGCTGTVSRFATVNQGPTPDFTGPSSVCGGNGALFSGTSSSVDAYYSWTFTSSNRTISTGGQWNNTSRTVNFNDTGLYTVSYTVQNAVNPTNNYCSNTITKTGYIRVLPPFNSAPLFVRNDCDAGSRGNITFAEFSRYAEKWEWDFGDGTPVITYTKANKPDSVRHTYTKTGWYTAGLTVTTGGCTFTTTALVTVLLDPVISFSNPATTCGNRTAVFTNTGSTVVTAYSWSFNNNKGNTAGGGGANPGIVFPDLGYYDARLTLRVNNCSYIGEIEPKVIQVLAPYPASIWSAVPNCNSNRGEVVFTENSKGTEKWDWSFDDGSTLSYTAANKPARTTHVFTTSGHHTYSFRVTTGSCSFDANGTVEVLLKQKPTLSAIQTAVCVDKDLDITLSGFETNPRGDFPNYSFYNFQKLEYEDFTPFIGTNRNTVDQSNQDSYRRGKWQTVYTGSLAGLSRERKEVRAITVPFNFPEYSACPDTSNFVTMRIDGPTTVIKVVKNNVCNKESVVFEDLSTVPAGNSIVSRRWNFGDGQTQTSTDANNPVKHLYSGITRYNASLTVTDNMGCSETKQVDAIMAGPRADFTMSPTPATNKGTVYFYNNSTAYGASPEYKWDYSYDGFKTTLQSPPPRTYPKGGPATDVVTLIAYNKTSGCADTMVRNLDIINVNLAFSMTTKFMDGGCIPVLVTFPRKSTGYSSFKWDFGDGKTLDDPNGSISTPGHIYQQPGKYKVILYSGGFGNSRDTTMDSVIIRPLASAGNVQSNVQEACSEKTVELKAAVGNAASLTWDYGDGTLATVTQPQASYKYTSGGIYKPAITVKNSDGCATAASLNTTILIDTLNISLQPQPNKICDSAVVDFNPVVKSLGADQLGRSLQYSWNFGTTGAGNTSTAIDPTFKYNKAGNYTATLRVRSQAGCDKTTTTAIKVITTPTISVTAVDEVCAKSTVSFKGNATPSAGVTWRWDFKNGQSSTAQNPDAVTYNTPGNYRVQFIADNEGCTRYAEHPLDVRALPVVNPMNDTTIVIGFSVPMQATGSSDITRWSWSPATYLDCASCATATSVPRKHIRYEVTGYNQYGCAASASKGIRLICAETPIFIPNTFTPNKDGRNDRFYPRGKGVSSVKFFRIYNRLGEMIFERRNFNLNDPAEGWDGTFNGKELTSGVFTYATDMICDAGETFSMKGNIMLIR